ncbi:MAG: catalase-peroxidase, partial [Ekhidna sp.]|nr:catalase-peroxidase [Ekhidna sp.]
MHSNNNGDPSQCPFLSGTQKSAGGSGVKNRDWWPNELKLNILRQHATKSNPMGEDFSYKEAFNSIDFAQLKKEVT